MGQMVPNVSKGSECVKMCQNPLTHVKTGKNRSKRVKTGQNGSKRLQTGQNGSKRVKTIKNKWKLVKMDENGWKQMEINWNAGNREKPGKRVKTGPKSNKKNCKNRWKRLKNGLGLPRDFPRANPPLQNLGGCAPSVLQLGVCPRKIPQEPSHCPLAQCQHPWHSP